MITDYNLKHFYAMQRASRLITFVAMVVCYLSRAVFSCDLLLCEQV